MTEHEEQYGLGVRIVPRLRRVEFLFEAAGVAEDEDGKPAPAATMIAVTLEKGKRFKPIAEYEKQAARIAETGLKLPGDDTVHTLRRITWEQYKEYED